MLTRKDEFKTVKLNESWPLVRRIYGLVAPFRKLFWLVNVLTFAFIILEVAQIRLIGTGFNQVEALAEKLANEVHPPDESFWRALLDPPSGFLEHIRFLAILILVLAVLRGVLVFASRLAMSRLGESITWRLRSLLFQALQRQSFSYYDKNYSGQLINRVTTDVQHIRQMTNMAWFTLLQTFIYTVGYFGMMLWIHPGLALASMVMVPAAVWVMLRMAKKLRGAFHHAREGEDDMVTALQENIAGAEVVKAFAREDAEISRFSGLNDGLLGRIMIVVDLFRTNIPLYRTLVRTNLVVCLGFGGYLVMNDRLMIGDLVVFTMAVNQIGNQLRQIIVISNIIQEALASSERVFEILDAQPEVEEKPDAQDLPPGPGRVTFENVTFGYNPEHPVLKGIDLEIEPGEVIALVGPTGAGKTTLINLIPRFYDPDSGRVLIDGVPVDTLTLNSLRQSIGLVFQETFLFSDTAANNIAFGVPEVSREDVMTAARLARAHDFTEELEEGYETVIGERGVTLSGGQQQRLAIARALVKNPRILVLDDAMAAVDSATEREIASDLEEVFENRTVFIIAHRLSSVKRADRVVVIEDGRITAIGSHEDLMRSEGHYRQMAELQLGHATGVG